MHSLVRNRDLGSKAVGRAALPAAPVKQFWVRRRHSLVLPGVTSIAAAVLLAFGPAVVGFAAAVGVAIAWCRWLEEHPDDEILEANVVLAQSVGATVIKVVSDDASDGLVALADRESVTHVL